MSQKEKTIRDLDPRDIKLSTVAKFFGGIWTIAMCVGLFYGCIFLLAVFLGEYSYDSDGLVIGILNAAVIVICGAELKYKFIKPAIQKIFS